MNNTIITAESFDQFIVDKGMDFDVATVPTPVHSDILAINPDAKSRQFQIFRTDNGEIFHSGMSKRYHPIQNRQALGFIKELAETSGKPLEFVSGGTWNGGAQTFAQIKMGESYVGNCSDVIDYNITFGNSHNGTYSMKVVLSPTRLFCANQIGVINRAMARGGAEISFNIRHSEGAIVQMSQITEQIRIIDNEFVNAVEDYNKLALIKTDEEYVEAILNDIFPHNGEREGLSKENFDLRVADVKQRYQSADDGRVDKDTAWNLYNSVQGSIQHAPVHVLRHTNSVRNAKGVDNWRIANSRLQHSLNIDRSKSVLMGTIARDSRLALDSVIKLTS